MRKLFFSLFMLTAPLLSGLHAEECCSSNITILAQRDFEAVNDYVNTKRSIDLSEKASNLTLSGDIRAIWGHTNERLRGWQQRGKLAPIFDEAAGVPYGHNDFNVDFNFYLDYVCGRSWAVAWVAYDNIAGTQAVRNCDNLPGAFGVLTGSGDCDGLCLRKAYIGYNFLADGDTRIDVEVGRRPLWTIFDSRVEFYNRFDGVLFKFAQRFPCWVDLYCNAGAFVIDERVNHFGYAGEIGALNIMDKGVDLKLSYIDWAHVNHNRCGVDDPVGAKYRVLQGLCYYTLAPELLCLKVQFYGAGLINLAADPSLFDNLIQQEVQDAINAGLIPGPAPVIEIRGKQNLGWYAGIMLGDVVKAGNWCLDINYQWIEALTIPDCDMSGIGNGNAYGYCIASGSTYEDMLGNGNYRGWRFEGLYAVTDNLTVDTILQFSHAINEKLGGEHEFSQLIVQCIYAF